MRLHNREFSHHQYRLPASTSQARQRGIAIGVVIIALWMLAVLTAIAALSSRDPARGANVLRMARLITAQSALIRQQITTCVLDYPNGNNGDPSTFDAVYPAGTVGDLIGGTGVVVRNLTCPGAPGTPGFWSNSKGDFPFAQIPGCYPWIYFNNKYRVTVYQLEFEIMCYSKDGLAALAQVHNQFPSETLFVSDYTTNDTLLFALHQ